MKLWIKYVINACLLKGGNNSGADSHVRIIIIHYNITAVFIKKGVTKQTNIVSNSMLMYYSWALFSTSTDSFPITVSV